ncbi:MAG TPA: anthranilate synthase component I family protein [Vicinamibacteria bacterium]|nr:anthranilate synthase component I family protein [Vicinamibacteria bacterium]
MNATAGRGGGPASSAAYRALLGTRGPCVLFETTGGATGGTRRSLLARHPRAVLVADATGVFVSGPSGFRRAGSDPIAAVRALLDSLPPGDWPDEGAVAGAIAYDFARPGPGGPTPHMVALAVDRLLVEEDGRLVAPGSGPGRDVVDLDGPWTVASPPPGRVEAPVDLARWSNLPPAAHRHLVRRIQDHIAAGDIYQANLSQRFSLPWAAGGLALYARLRTLSPAPFAGYLRAAGLEIVSASPERLVEVRGRRATTRPIAGTRPRAAEPAADRALAAELLASEKERAEHLMLVDLARNDLGKVAETGSVAVAELMTIEDYAQVRHIVSGVEARLAPGRGPLDALLALFPGGTITGVPKRRCMEILDALEPVRRGFYTGALFYVTPSGRLDANILIRSGVVAGGALTFHTGGGIVADSEPAFEYAETLHKAEGMRQAIEAVLAS